LSSEKNKIKREKQEKKKKRKKEKGSHMEWWEAS
jgi:hypothetical protein